MYMRQRHAFLARVIIFFGVLCAPLCGMHNGSRYFPFLERPEPYKIPYFGQLYVAPYFTEATGASVKDAKKLGIPELWGKYDLKNVIQSLQLVTESNGCQFQNPLACIPGLATLVDKSIVYNQEGRIRSIGAWFEYNQALFKSDFSLGINIIAMQVNASAAFCLDQGASDSAVCSMPTDAVDALDGVRRCVEMQAGIVGTDWSASGVSDLDIYLRWHNEQRFKLLMRSIDTTLSLGVLAPTSRRQDYSQATSIPFMGNGHTGLYFDFLTEAELQTNWRLGFMFGLLQYFPKTQQSRIPVACEPLIYSALCGPLEVRPGMTFKYSTYFTLENMLDGFHLQFRFTCLHHNKDRMVDRRPISQQMVLPSTLRGQEELSAWQQIYLTFQLIYDTEQAMKHWSLQPRFYASYDWPLEAYSYGAAKMNTVVFGVECNF